MITNTCLIAGSFAARGRSAVPSRAFSPPLALLLDFGAGAAGAGVVVPAASGVRLRLRAFRFGGRRRRFACRGRRFGRLAARRRGRQHQLHGAAAPTPPGCLRDGRAATLPSSTPKPTKTSTSSAETRGDGSSARRARRSGAAGRPTARPAARVWRAARALRARRRRSCGCAASPSSPQQRVQLRAAGADALAAAQAVALIGPARRVALRAAAPSRSRPPIAAISPPCVTRLASAREQRSHGERSSASRSSASQRHAERRHAGARHRASASCRTASRTPRRGCAAPRSPGSCRRSRSSSSASSRSTSASSASRSCSTAARRTSTSRRKWSRDRHLVGQAAEVPVQLCHLLGERVAAAAQLAALVARRVGVRDRAGCRRCGRRLRPAAALLRLSPIASPRELIVSRRRWGGSWTFPHSSCLLDLFSSSPLFSAALAVARARGPATRRPSDSI